jgi:hypothetical protein
MVMGALAALPMVFDALGAFADVGGAAADGIGAGEAAKAANAEGSGGGNEFDNLLTTLINDLTGQSSSASGDSPPTAAAAA